ncbi:hypothetical protein CLM76_09435 [Vreelandella venusta]|nr:hypothetical protein CLM76_09435 [Halomonas hydrothermalis]
MPNYEAIGRCKHISDEINKLVRERAQVLRDLSASLAADADIQADQYSVPNVTTEYHQQKLEKVDRLSQEITDKVSEHNKWAKEAEAHRIVFER